MKTRQLILTMGFLSTLFGCGSKNILTDEERNICITMSFDEKIAESIKRETNGSIELIPEVSEYGEILSTKDNGLCSIVDERKAYDFILREKENFRKNGYLLFLFEGEENEKYIGTIKGEDELDIIQWRQTNGINHGHENTDIVKKLKAWREQNDFIVLGTSMDWLELQFKTMPDDVDSFAEDVYAFCPDIIDQGVGDMPTLIKEIQRMRGVYLWWD